MSPFAHDNTAEGPRLGSLGVERIRVAVIGAGQAGLAASYWLSNRDVDHVLFDRDGSGSSWRSRWDSFCLVTPNWTLNLPGFPYSGDDPDGFLPRDQIAGYVSAYRDSFGPTVVDSTEVTRLSRSDGLWRIDTNNGDWEAEAVVVATGAYPFENIPSATSKIDPSIVQMHSHDYRNPGALPDGSVLVVGSGQSGAQIVDDLVIAGREVWASIGHTLRGPRRYRGKDLVSWFRDMHFFDTPFDDPDQLKAPSVVVSGRDGGKDLDFRDFGRRGVRLIGRIESAQGSVLHLGADVEQMLDAADTFAAELCKEIDDYIDQTGIEAERDEPEVIDWAPPPAITELDLEAAGITSIVWATGYHYDFSWIEGLETDNHGLPHQERGVADLPGLYFIGLHGQHSAQSSLFIGVGEDARYLVDQMEL